jgi:hypothetical protein
MHASPTTASAAVLLAALALLGCESIAGIVDRGIDAHGGAGGAGGPGSGGDGVGGNGAGGANTGGDAGGGGPAGGGPTCNTAMGWPDSTKYCYQDGVTCLAGEDGAVVDPAQDYEIWPGGEVVLDRVTCLEWHQAAANPGVVYSWQDASDHCSMSTVAGGGWRLPSVHELVSIVDYGRPSPLLDLVFSQEPHVYWAQNAHGLSHYIANFNGGAVAWFLDNGTTTTDARCVRGMAPVFDFVVMATTTVHENTTRLEWVRYPTEMTNWDGARASCEDLVLGVGGWRLPNVKELVTTLVPSNPTVLDPAFGPGPMATYWTSTPVRAQAQAFIVDNDPQIVVTSAADVGDTHAVRCVRPLP